MKFLKDTKTRSTLLVFLMLNNFFGIITIPFAVSVPLAFWCLFMGYRYRGVFKIPLNVVYLGVLLSFISCWIYRDQTLFESFQSWPYIYGLFFYFYLKYKKLNLQQTEELLEFLILTFEILYLLQYFLYGYGINFMNIPEWSQGGGVEGFRLRAISSGLYSLGIFYGLVKWNISKETKYLYIFLLGLLCLLLAGYRQMLMSLALTSIFFYYKYIGKFNWKLFSGLITVVVIFLILMQIPAVQQKIAGFQEREEIGESWDNPDYIRYVQLSFYYTEYFHDKIELFLGSGYPYFYSKFGQYIYDYLGSQRLLFVDWGIIGLSWMYGITTLVGWLFFSIKAIMLKVSKCYGYVCLWYIFLLISVTNAEFYRDGNFLVHGLVLYLIEQAYLQLKNRKKNKNVIYSNSFVQ